MRFITLDFETYYAQDYSLSIMPTQCYVLDRRFEMIGGAYAIDDGPVTWHVGESVITELERLELDQEGTVTIVQNAQFDGSILEMRYGIRPWRYFCTMMGARPNVSPFVSGRSKMGLAALADYFGWPPKGTEVVQAKGKRLRDFTPSELAAYGEYCEHDVDLCRRLAWQEMPDIPEREQGLIDLTIKKFTRPRLRLDKSRLRIYGRKIKAEKDALLARIDVDAGELRSNDKFAELLRAEGVEPPTKTSLTTGKQTWAFAKTDPEMQELAESNNPRISALIAARLGHKSSLAETRAASFLSIAETEEPFGVPLLYWGAGTGRFSGTGSINLQNIPKGGELRKAIIAPPGYSIVAGDLKQIEARVLAWLADERQLMQLFAENGDPYIDFAAQRLYHCAPEAVTAIMRKIAKIAVLGLGYGMGHLKFADFLRTMGVTQNDLGDLTPKQIVGVYRSTYTKIKALWDIAQADWLSALIGITGPVSHKGCLEFMHEAIVLPNGLGIMYPNITGPINDAKYGLNQDKHTYGAKCVENVTQALARIVMTDAELYLANRGIRAVLSVHDELVFVVPTEKVGGFAKVLKAVLNRPVPWAPGLIVDSEITWGQSYGEQTEIN